MRFLDTHGKPAEIVFEPLAFGAPLAVWVFAFHQGQLVLGKSREDGLQWIVGTLGATETPDACAKRAAVELLSLRVAELRPIGQFRGLRADGGPRRSTIYVARVTKVEALPLDSLMSEVVVADPADLTYLREGNRFMQDPAFAIVMTYIVAKGLVPD